MSTETRPGGWNSAAPRALPADPSVLAVVLHWGLRETTTRCLQSLRDAAWPGPLKVVVVDNSGHLADAIARAASPLDVQVLRPGRNTGFAEGSNVGLSLAARSAAEFVLLLNNDVVVDPSFLAGLVSAARDGGGAGLLSPQILMMREPDRAWYRGGAFSLWAGIPAQGQGRRAVPAGRPPREVDYATGCAMLVRRAMLQHVGPFDPAFFAYCEDLDLSIRARRAGYRVLFVPGSVVYHDVADEPERAALRIYYSTRNLLEVMRKHAAWYHWLSFVANFATRWVAFFAAQAVVRGEPRYLMALLRGMIDFARQRFGKSAWASDTRAAGSQAGPQG